MGWLASPGGQLLSGAPSTWLMAIGSESQNKMRRPARATVPVLLGGAGRATCDCEGRNPRRRTPPLSRRVASCVRAIWCQRGFEPPAAPLAGFGALPLLRSRTPPYARQVFDRRPRCQGRVSITVPRVSYRGSFSFGRSARGRFYGPGLLVRFGR